MSKGSRPRPLSVPQETFAERWERAFGAQPRNILRPVLENAVEHNPQQPDPNCEWCKGAGEYVWRGFITNNPDPPTREEMELMYQPTPCHCVRTDNHGREE